MRRANGCTYAIGVPTGAATDVVAGYDAPYVVAPYPPYVVMGAP